MNLAKQIGNIPRKAFTVHQEKAMEMIDYQESMFNAQDKYAA